MTYIKGEGKAGRRRARRLPVLPAWSTLADEDGLVIARGEQVYAVLNLYPYNPGHLMVRAVPARRRTTRT